MYPETCGKVFFSIVGKWSGSWKAQAYNKLTPSSNVHMLTTWGIDWYARFQFHYFGNNSIQFYSVIDTQNILSDLWVIHNSNVYYNKM